MKIAKTKNLERSQWLKLRQQGIGGSDAAAILGISRYKSPIDVWVEKTVSQPIEADSSEYTYWGNLLESVVADEFQRQTGLKIRRCNYLLQNTEYPFMLANIDREIIGQKSGLECKTTSEYNKNKWQDDEIPAEYILQCQHYMAVTGYESWWIAVLIGGNKFIYKQIQRDDELIQMLIKAEQDFWQNYVVPKIMPPVDGSTACTNILGQLYAQSNGNTIDLDAEAKTLLEQRQLLKASQEALTEKINEIDNIIKSKLGDNEVGMVDKYLVKWTNTVSNKLDSKLLKSQYPDVYQSCLKSSASRRFTVSVKAVKEAK